MFLRVDGEKSSEMEALQHGPVVLEFENLRYSPPGQEDKEILKGVNGRFRPCNLSAILGPSGAGKTTLLNILTGHRTAGVQGSITVNGQPLNKQQFRKQCCYITQEFAMLGLLTVKEVLQSAANLKLPGRLSCPKRKALIEEKVNEVMEILGMMDKHATRVRYISHGERKRLSIGVELLTNPPVMFFDEPTSGLDSTSSLQVMNHLQSLARRGITVVVVIHQPSSRCFQYCDDVFLMSKGCCLYNGPSKALGDTFASFQLECPPYFNIAEFAVEVASKDEAKEFNKLVTKAQEDFRCRSGEFFSDGKLCLTNKDDDTTNEKSPMLKSENNELRIPIHKSYSSGYPISSFDQFRVLLKRCTLCINRELNLSGVRLFTHFIVAVLMGILFYDFGNDASKILGNFSFVFFNIMFIFFATTMPTITTFPFEAEVFLREQSNNWYPTRVYFFAKVVADMPLQVLCPTIFLVIGWYMTGQPLEWFRFGMLWLVCVLVAMLAQAVGNTAGVTFTIQTANFTIPASTIPVLLVCGFFVKIKDLYLPFQILSKFSYFKFAFEAACQSVFGYDRPRLPCHQPYCHYRHVDKFLKDIGMSDYTYWTNILGLLAWIVLMQTVLYIAIKWKLSKAKV